MHHSGPHLYRAAGTATQGQGFSGPREGKERGLSAVVPAQISFFFCGIWIKLVKD